MKQNNKVFIAAVLIVAVLFSFIPLTGGFGNVKIKGIAGTTDSANPEPYTDPANPSGDKNDSKCDVDGDGAVTPADARWILRCAAGLEKPEHSSLPSYGYPGDVDGDRKISAADARLTLRAAIGLEHYPEEPDGYPYITDCTGELRLSCEQNYGDYVTLNLSADNAVGTKYGEVKIIFNQEITSYSCSLGQDAKLVNNSEAFNDCNMDKNLINGSELVCAFYFRHSLWEKEEWLAEDKNIGDVNTDSFSLASIKIKNLTSKEPIEIKLEYNHEIQQTLSLEWDYYAGTYKTADHSETNHIYGPAVYTPATCTECGYGRYTCRYCDAHIDYIIEVPYGHVWNDGVITLEPSCTSNGMAHYQCRNCEATKDEPVAMLGHSFNAVTKDPTCVLRGKTTYTCERCEHVEYAYSPALGHADDDSNGICDICGMSINGGAAGGCLHDFKLSYTPATCTTAGEVKMECKLCKISSAETIPATGHNYVDFVIEPTCTSDGYTKHYCINCGDELRDTPVKALGHAMRTQTITPTCTEQGCDIMICDNCGYNYEANVVAAAGHKVMLVNAIEADKYTDGYTGDIVCSVCNALLEAGEVIPAQSEGGEDTPQVKCSHLCHKSGILGFFWKLINLFNKLFKINQFCECGAAHW